MATPLKPPNTIDFNSARLNSNKVAKSSQADLYDQRFRLSSVLQTTLDVEHLLKLFFNEILTSIHLDGLRYANELQQLQVTCGKQTTHSCGYRLITPKDHLGEISFYHSKRFSENDLATIETFLSTLLCPLRNAVHYHEAINDNYGHSAGDDILKQLVNTISLANRCTDICFRYGGEEFLVILNKTALEGATVIAERIRKSVEELEVFCGKDKLKFTISIGATTLEKGETSDNLFNRADSALYVAKQNGKNQISAS